MHQLCAAEPIARMATILLEVNAPGPRPEPINVDVHCHSYGATVFDPAFTRLLEGGQPEELAPCHEDTDAPGQLYW